MKRCSTLALTGAGLVWLTVCNTARGDIDDPQALGAVWQQWALSIPTSVNPQLGADSGSPAQDYSTLGKCFVGQRGIVWFLAGTFGGGSATRTCSIPADKLLFFPVINSIQIDTPGVCGQVGHISVANLRAAAADFIKGVTSASAQLDGVNISDLTRLLSPVFDVALPENNIFDALCAPLNVPAGIYSPAVDDGLYVLIRPLKPGPHKLRIRAANPASAFTLDVTYMLNVVEVSK